VGCSCRPDCCTDTAPTIAPHEEQNLALFRRAAPQFLQNRGGGATTPEDCCGGAVFTTVPHSVQNFALSFKFLPQFLQNMTSS